MKKITFLIIIVFQIALSGCNFAVDDHSKPEQSSSPENGKAFIFGKLISSDSQAQAGVVVRLAEVYRDDLGSGTFILDEGSSPSTISDLDGLYSFNNIEPGEYVVFVGTLHDDYKIVSGPDQTPIVYLVNSDESLEIEPIVVDFE